MIIKTAQFVKSSPALKDCPKEKLPEFAFIGRSNVGKSSLINMLTGFGKLAKTSGQPGKTQTINHFIINDEWFLADLPGYGYAKVSKKKREVWNRSTLNYVFKRENLVCLFILIDCRHDPQQIDLDFMELVTVNHIPFCRIFTKSDKLTERKIQEAVKKYDDTMFAKWESMPPSFITSSINSRGRDEILKYVSELVHSFEYRAAD